MAFQEHLNPATKLMIETLKERANHFITLEMLVDLQKKEGGSLNIKKDNVMCVIQLINAEGVVTKEHRTPDLFLTLKEIFPVTPKSM